MKNKLLITLLSFASLVLVISLSNVEPAEAYYGNWKSQTENCKVSHTLTTLNIWTGTITSTTTEYSGTRRNCVDGSGSCWWGSSCG